MSGHTKPAVAATIILGLAFMIIWFAPDQIGRAQPAGSLIISMTDNPDPVALGGVVTYTIAVENTGSSEESGVVVEDSVSGPATIQSVAPSQGFCDPPTPTSVTCNLGTLPANSTATIVVKKLAVLPVGGTVELLAGGGDVPPQPAGGSGPSVPYAAMGGGAGAAALAIVVGGWYVRRRWLG